MTFKKATAVISIDDGNFHDYRTYEEILKKYNLPATFNIVSGRIGKDGYLTAENLKTIYNDKTMEIAAHGFEHKNDDEDVTKGVDELFKLLETTPHLVGFASPGSNMKNDFIAENKQHLKSMGLLYVRTSTNPSPTQRHSEITEKVKAKNVSEYVINNVPQLTFSPQFCVNSVVVLHDTDVNDLKTLVDLTIEEKACIVFMFHHTKKPDEEGYDNLWNYDYYKFKEFAEYLSKSDIEVLTTKDAFKNCP